MKKMIFKVIILLLLFLLYTCDRNEEQLIEIVDTTKEMTITSAKGAKITIDDKTLESPAKFILEIGNEYEIIVSSKGFHSQKRKLIVDGNSEKYYIHLKSKPTVLILNIQQEDTIVFLNDKEIKQKMELNSGKYKLKVIKSGFTDFEEDLIILDSDEEKVVNINLDLFKYEINNSALTLSTIDVYSDILLEDMKLNLPQMSQIQLLKFIPQYNIFEILIESELGYIRNKDLIQDFINFNNRIIGIIKEYKIEDNGYDHNYIQELSKICVYDENDQKYISSSILNPTDELEIKINEHNLEIISKYNKFRTMHYGYTLHSFYSLSEINITKPHYYYFSEIGGQDRPTLKIKNTKFLSDKIILSYDYKEMVGLPDLGKAYIDVIYSKSNNNVTFEKYFCNKNLDHNTFKLTSPQNGYNMDFSDNYYLNQLWRNEDNFTNVPLETMNIKFKHLINDFPLFY